ncbi:MAG: hypothetical protein IPO15_13680, partial [Anaerolineae bacterium]|nr:hypothetical protein [Anaerolineae bacterium]
APCHVRACLAHSQEQYQADTNDLTPEVLKNPAWLGADYMIPTGGDDTLSHGVRLAQEGLAVAILRRWITTPGTNFLIGFSTCVTRTIAMTNILRILSGFA